MMYRERVGVSMKNEREFIKYIGEKLLILALVLLLIFVVFDSVSYWLPDLNRLITKIL